MRKIETEKIVKLIEDNIKKIACVIDEKVESSLRVEEKQIKSNLPKTVLSVMNENISIAKKNFYPVCQDTGMCIIYLSIGQNVKLVGGSIREEINVAVERAFKNLRKSVVDPITRKNTGTNTPCIIYFDIIEGEKVNVSIMLKGFGSENVSKSFMLAPHDINEQIVNSVVSAIKGAGSCACPPYIVGVGVGGTFEYSAYLSKKALLREIGVYNSRYDISQLEKNILEKSNELNIGPQGMGDGMSVINVAIESFATHIAGLPVSVNICCHLSRHCEFSI